MEYDAAEQRRPQPGTGAVLAVLVSAGAACGAMGLVYAAATVLPAVGRGLTWYGPAGALSGMAAVTVLVWLALWAVLHRRWSSRAVAVGRPLTLAFGLLVLGMLLTFPPLLHLF